MEPFHAVFTSDVDETGIRMGGWQKIDWLIVELRRHDERCYSQDDWIETIKRRNLKYVYLNVSSTNSISWTKRNGCKHEEWCIDHLHRQQKENMIINWTTIETHSLLLKLMMRKLRNCAFFRDLWELSLDHRSQIIMIGNNK